MKVDYTPIILGTGMNFSISYASNIEALGLGMRGMADPGMTASRTTVVSHDLAGQEDDTFNNKYWMQVIHNTNSVGNAPEMEIVKISDYTSATGTFTLAGTGFSANVEEQDELLIIHELVVAMGRDTASDEFSSTNVLANADGTVLQRLEDLRQTLNPVADWTELDRDPFDVLDADANTERWDAEYITDNSGGDASINDDTAGKLYIKADYNVAGASRYAVSKSLPIFADFFVITEDVTCTWGTTDGATAKAVGIGVSAGAAYDSTNYIFIERQKGTGIDRIQVRYNLNDAGEVVDNTAGSITDDAIAFKIERLDQTWRLYYSLLPEPDQTWVLAAQIEDTSNYMTNEVSFYQETFNGTNTDANETAQGDFDNFFAWIGSGGGAQFLVGNYDSSYIAAGEADIGGNLFEIENAQMNAVGVVDAGSDLGFEEDGAVPTLFNTLITIKGETTGAGGIKTMVSTDLGGYAAGYLIGNLIVPLEGAQAGLGRTITGFDGTSLVTVHRPWVAAPGTSCKFIILTQQGSLKSLAGGLLTTSSTTVPADNTRGEGNDFFNGNILVPLTGAAAFQAGYIVDFTTATGVFTIDPEHPFPVATGAVPYLILAGDAGVSLIPGTDGTNNYTMSQIVGSKVDTASYVGNGEDSLVSYAKGTLASINAGAQMSIKINNGDARTNLEQILEDFFVVWGMNDTTVFDPTVRGVSCTTLEMFFDELGKKLEEMQPNAVSHATLYDEVHANLDLAETDATTTTLDESEQTLYEESDTRPFEFRGGEVDLNAMAVGDIVRFRVYTKAALGGTYRKISNDADWTFRDAQTEQPGVPFDGISAHHGFKITIEHTLAAGAFDVVHSWRDAKAGN